MSSELRQLPLRWALSLAFVLTSLALLWAFQAILAAPYSVVSYSVSADNGGTTGTGGGGPPNGDVLLGFTDVEVGSAGFLESLVVANDGSEHEIAITAFGLSPGVHDTLQVLITHDPSVVEITAVECVGPFAGAFSPSAPVFRSPGETAFMCSVEGGVQLTTDTVMRVSLKRINSGETSIGISTDGPFGTQVFAAGVDSPVAPFGALAIQDPVVLPTPTSAPTVTPTSVAPTAGPPGGGSSGGSSPAQAAPAPSASTPGIPTDLVAVPGDGQIRLSWNPPADSDGTPIIGNTVRSADGKIVRQFTATQGSVVITGLENGTEYRFRVQAINSVGVGPFSELSGPAVPAGPPSPPEDLSANVVAELAQVTLTWNPPSDTNGASISSYTLSEADTLVEPVKLDSEASSHTFSGLSPGEYRFLAAAENRGGVSAAAEITLTVPSALLASPGDSPAAVEAEDPSEQHLNEMTAQIRNATGSHVVLTGAPLEIRLLDDVFRVILPVEIAPGESQNPGDAEPGSESFTGFTLEELSVESHNGRPSTATFDLGNGFVLSGDVALLTTPEAVTAELRNLSLRYELPDLTANANRLLPIESLAIETEVLSLLEVPTLTVLEFDEIGVPELPAPPALRSVLLDAGWVVVSEQAGDQHILGTAWQIDHDEGLFSAGDTRFSFVLSEAGAAGFLRQGESSLIAIKQDHFGTVHVRPVICEETTPGTVSCYAVFDGEAGGFSTFAVLEAIPVQLQIKSNAVTAPVATQEPAPTPTPVPTALVEEASANVIPTATPAPVPTTSNETILATDFGDLEPTQGNGSGSPSAIVLIALASVGVITAAGASRYVIGRARNWNRAELSILAIPIIASTLVVIASATPTGAHPASASGVVVTQGDAAQQTDAVRSAFGLDGAGVTVGVISDSIGCDEPALLADIAAGELPAGLNRDDDATALFCPFVGDGGREIAQVIHDVAPGADIIFKSALKGASSLEAKIDSLVDMGADIIIDDLLFGDELFFQEDGLSSAISDANAAGVVYITSAGESRIASYESDFVDGGSGPLCGPSGVCSASGNWHDFDPGPGVDPLLSISLSNETAQLFLQWDQPVSSGGGGLEYDLDLFLFDELGEPIATSSTLNSITGLPAEGLSVVGPATVQVAVSHRSGVDPGLLKLLVTSGATVNEHATGSSTIVGHRNADGAITVGPVNYGDTAAFGGVPLVEDQSPIGGMEILFDANGNQLSPGQVGQKPDIVAPSGGDTTMGVFDASPAAAAHVAGAVALLLELRSDLHDIGLLTPETVRQVLRQTTVEVGGPGPDLVSGYGLIDAFAAANMLMTEPPVTVEDSYSTTVDEVLSISAPGLLSNDSDQDVSSLTAELWTGPTNGNLLLESDGSFTYTPTPGFVGEDSFSYIADDSLFKSLPAVVTITVIGPQSFSTSVTLQGVDALSDFGADLITVGLSLGAELTEVDLIPGGPGLAMKDGLAPGSYEIVARTSGFLPAVATGVVLAGAQDETVFLTAVELFAGDANADGSIDIADAEIVSGAFGAVHPPGDRSNGAGEITDLNGDGVTNGADASLTVSNIGHTGPSAWTQ